MMNKLKREWKTLAWGAVSLVVESYDSFLAPMLSMSPLLPPEYKWVDAMMIPFGFFLLRKWYDEHEAR